MKNKKSLTSKKQIDHPISSSSNSEHSVRTAKKKRKKSFIILERALIILAVIAFSIGLFLIISNYYNEAQRTKKVDTILTDIREGDGIIRVNPTDFIVEGEGYEDFGDEALRDIDMSIFDDIDEIQLVAAGTIEIESIDLNLPLWTTADLVSLRYGAGILEGSVQPGSEGNLVVLGHRMRTKGSIFNRLNEVELNDQIIITLMDGTFFQYEVTQIIPMLEPSDLPTVIGQKDVQGKQITLVTCTPVGNSTHRLIVIGHIVE